MPRIIVRTHPAELLQTGGMPDFKSISGTSLQYAVNTDSPLFFDSEYREAYLLISGRWFRATSLNGPWDYVPPQDLPADFAKIPPNSPQAIVLASVPGTPQAEAALLAITTPTTATVNRHDAKIQLEYDGEPQFKSITGTDMSYAVNAKLPVILADGSLLCGGQRRMVHGQGGDRAMGGGDGSAGKNLHDPAGLAGLLRHVCPRL